MSLPHFLANKVLSKQNTTKMQYKIQICKIQNTVQNTKLQVKPICHVQFYALFPFFYLSLTLLQRGKIHKYHLVSLYTSAKKKKLSEMDFESITQMNRYSTF